MHICTDKFISGQNEKRFLLFSRLPEVLIDLSFSLLSIPDLLRASRSCKELLKSANRVLARIRALNFAFLPSFFLSYLQLEKVSCTCFLADLHWKVRIRCRSAMVPLCSRSDCRRDGNLLAKSFSAPISFLYLFLDLFVSGQ